MVVGPSTRTRATYPSTHLKKIDFLSPQKPPVVKSFSISVGAPISFLCVGTLTNLIFCTICTENHSCPELVSSNVLSCSEETVLLQGSQSLALRIWSGVLWSPTHD